MEELDGELVSILDDSMLYDYDNLEDCTCSIDDIIEDLFIDIDKIEF